MLGPQEIEEYFHRKIPMCRAMGVRVAEFNGSRLVLEAPLEANHNHLGTAFGGSLSAIATLAGYGMLWLVLDDPSVHVVIRDSSISFRRPVRGALRAVCERPADEVMKGFLATFARSGKARLQLAVTIEESGEVAVAFEGTFVAIRH